ncbi:MAG TPA: hypothetical protein VGD58_23840 [Herpetosiphonaceae bacterium]
MESTVRNEYTERRSVVEILLLQQYKVLLIRHAAIRITNRFIYLFITAIIIFGGEFSQLELIGISGITGLVGFIWYFESRSLGVQLLGLEDTLSSRIQDYWEDLYIKSRHNKSRGGNYLAFRILDFEPLLWIYCISLLIFSRVWPI